MQHPGAAKARRTSDQMELGFSEPRRGPARRPAANPAPPPKARTAEPQRRGPRQQRATAESMAAAQREISVSEFFAKNRHLLGFDNKRKALLTAVKEAVDNSLDACEEAGILPEIRVTIEPLEDERFRIIVRDNGPGIVKQQIPNIFGKLLYGSKFHRLRMSRGQQGIGISAAGMYGLLTTGRPIQVTSRVARSKEAHHYQIQIDTKKNRPEIIKDEIVAVDWEHGTEVIIDLAAQYAKGRQSVDEYLLQTAIANPHCTLIYKSPVDPPVEYLRSVQELPAMPGEIKPHPHGVELGVMMKMVKDTAAKQLGGFLQQEFSRVSGRVAAQICATAGVSPRTALKSMNGQTIEKVYQALQQTRIMAPATHCLVPIGAEQILSGLLQGVRAEFYTASTRPPAVYRGNPFQIEVGLAYGGDLGPPESEVEADSRKAEPPTARVIRFANRVPLLYQQSACCTFKSVLETKWGNYGISQARGALPGAPLLIFIHMASVWVPFTSESKEAIADYDEIRKEIKLAIQECARRLGALLRRKKRSQAYAKRRDVFLRYIDELVQATRTIRPINAESFKNDLLKLARQHTAYADAEFDEHGNRIEPPGPAELNLEHTIVVERGEPAPAEPALFDEAPSPGGRRRSKERGATAGKSTARRKTRGRG